MDIPLFSSCPLHSPGYETGSSRGSRQSGSGQCWPLHAVECGQAGSEPGSRQLLLAGTQQAIGSRLGQAKKLCSGQ